MNLFAAVAVRAITILVVAHYSPSVALVVAGLWSLYDGSRTEFGKLVVTWFVTLVIVTLVDGGQLLDKGIFDWAWAFVLGTVVVAVVGAAVGSLFAKPDTA
jgi:hypothetical protein